jgi:hypothetical protein
MGYIVLRFEIASTLNVEAVVMLSELGKKGIFFRKSGNRSEIDLHCSAQNVVLRS